MRVVEVVAVDATPGRLVTLAAPSRVETAVELPVVAEAVEEREERSETDTVGNSA